MNQHMLRFTRALYISVVCILPAMSYATKADSAVEVISAQKLFEQASKQVKQGKLNDEGMVNLLHVAAKKGHLNALLELASFYELGLAGIKKNHVKAAQYYEKAIRLGSDDARFNLALLLTTSDYYSEGGNLLKARSIITPLAKKGDAEAQYSLALMLKEEGTGAPADFNRSFYWLGLAANAGYANAEFNLGLHYLRGEQVEKSMVQAFNWFMKSANNGQPRAQFNLALMYEKGLGIHVDSQRSLQWYQSAVKLGNANAQNNLGIKYLMGDGLEENEDKALGLITKAATQQHKDAQYLLARIYQAGSSFVEADTRMAEELYLLSAKQGHREAQYQLALMLSGEKDSQLDAKYWAYRATFAGHEKAYLLQAGL